MDTPADHPPPRPATPPGPGDALLKVVQEALDVLHQVEERHGEVLDTEARAKLLEVTEAVARRLGRETLHVAVTGEKKAGKSTLLNALLGARILGTAARECTGTITSVRRGELPDFEATLKDGGTRTWLGEHPDPVPAIKDAQKRLHGELVAIRQEAAIVSKQARDQEAVLRAAQQELVEREGELRRAERARTAAADQTVQIQKARDTIAEDVEQQLTKLPLAATRPAVGGLAGLWGALLRWLHRRGLERLHAARAHLSGKDAALAWQKAAEATVTHALTTAADERGMAEQRLEAARDAHDEAIRQRSVLQGRAARLAVKRTGLIRRVERASAAWRVAFGETVSSATDMRRDGREVATMTLEWPSEALPHDIVIIDTPGLNTDNQENRARTWQAIEELADAILVVSDVQQAVSKSTLEFVDRVGGVVPHLALVLTKLDRAAENAAEVGGDPDEEVAEATDLAIRRFARQTHKTPDRILAISVAAERVLDTPPDEVWTPQFYAAMDGLLSVLRRERGLAVAARAATALRDAVVIVNASCRQAERTAVERLRTLESQRIPDPAAYCAGHLSACEGAVSDIVQRVEEVALEALEEATEAARLDLGAQIAACPDKAALSALHKDLESLLEVSLKHALVEVDAAAARAVGIGFTELRRKALAELLERYRIVKEAADVSTHPERWMVPLRIPALRTDIALGEAQREHEAERLMWGARGAAAGAALGLLLVGGIAVPALLAAGAAAATASWFSSLDRLKKRSVEALNDSIDQASATLRARIQARSGDTQVFLNTRLADALQENCARFAEWIGDVLEADVERREVMRRDLRQLRAMRDALSRHRTKLERGLTAAATQSPGIFYCPVDTHG